MEIELHQVEGRRFAIRARGNEVIVDDTVEAGGPGDGFRPTGFAPCVVEGLLLGR